MRLAFFKKPKNMILLQAPLRKLTFYDTSTF